MANKASPTDKNAMALFVKVVENCSFSKAALREGMPVSTVSRKISELEKSLGVRLLERSTRRLRVTEIGQDYFELCRRGLADFEAADLLVTDRRTEISGNLRISVPPSMSDTVVVPLVFSFQTLYPKATVHCLVTERFIDHIADGIDLSLRVGDLNDSSLVTRAVTVNQGKLVASPGYIERAGMLSHPQDILPHVQLAFSRWQRPLLWTLTAGESIVQLKPEPRLVVNDYAGVLRGVVDGQGISEIPYFICETALRDGLLCEVMPQWRLPALKVAVTYPSNRYLSPLVRAFKEFCVHYFEQSPLTWPD